MFLFGIFFALEMTVVIEMLVHGAALERVILELMLEMKAFMVVVVMMESLEVAVEMLALASGRTAVQNVKNGEPCCGVRAR